MQLSIDFDTPSLPMARAMGDEGMARALEHAETDEPGFSERAQKFVLRYLREHQKSSGELITDACKLAGIVPVEDRAFGPVYSRLLKLNLIHVIGLVPRRKGHGSLGAKLYALVDIDAR